MVLRISSADSQHKRGLTLLFSPPPPPPPLHLQLASFNFSSIWEYSLRQCQHKNTVHAKDVSLPTSWFPLSPCRLSAQCCRTSQNPRTFATEMSRVCPAADTGSLGQELKTKCDDNARLWSS